jgi:hypothetical protein
MKPLRWWAPVMIAVIAVVFGVLPYALLSSAGMMPHTLRDNPWPLEIGAVVASLLAIALAVSAYMQKRVRAVATVGAALSVLSTAAFLLLVHVGSYGLPPPPKELAVGTAAPEFTLPDEAGNPIALASLRGHATVLVFYRGVW